jgi:HlyD family secretion protein
MKASAPLAPEDLATAIKAGGPHKHSKLRLILVLVVLVLAAAAWFWWRQSVKKQHQAPAFATEVLSRGDVSLTITATGNLYPTNEVTVGSELSGTTMSISTTG